ncbi:MAG TPA: hypothetical protein PKD91_09190 [Bacteroidia bacterium]|nr:hypothetical protein [Bacteroidia bacterium]
MISVLIIYFIEKYVAEWTHLYTLIFGIYFLILLAFFFYTTRKAAGRREPTATEVKL